MLKDRETIKPDETSPLSDGWRRLEPIALVVYLVVFVRQLLSNGLPALLPLLALMASLDGGRKYLLIGAVAFLSLLAIVFALASYWRFSYRIEGERLLVKRGVFSRENLAIDFSRIQTVSINTPFYARWFDAVTLGVDTAGSAGKETSLAAIPKALAESFRLQVAAYGQAHAHPSQSSTSDGAPNAVADQLLATIKVTDLIRYGFSQINLIWVAVVVGFASQYMAWSDFAEYSREHYSGLFAAVDKVLELGLIADILMAIALIAVLTFLLGSLSVVGALLKFHNFRLSQEGDRFISHAGLLNRRQKSLRLHRIQALEIHQNALARLFGRVKLVLRLTAPGGEAQSIAGLQTAAQFVIPGVTMEQARSLAQVFQPGLRPMQMAYTRPSKQYVYRTWLYFILPPTLVAVAFFGGTGWWWLPAMAIALSISLLLPIFLGWRRYGIAVNRNHVGMRSGFIGFKFVYFEQTKCQRVDLRESRGQRRRGMGTLGIHLTSHSIEIPWLPMCLLRPIRNLLLYGAAANPGAGMEHLPG